MLVLQNLKTITEWIYVGALQKKEVTEEVHMDIMQKKTW